MNGLDYDVYTITELPEVQLDEESGEVRISNQRPQGSDRQDVSEAASGVEEEDHRQLKLRGQSHPEDILPGATG
jgi:hypothetical protein